MIRSNKKSFPRTDKINELFKRELSFVLKDEFRDPRIGLVTILFVETTKDLSLSKIYFTVLEQEKIEITTKVLNKASGFFRSYLAKKINLKKMPKLIFIYDDSNEQGNKIEQLLKSLEKN